MIIYPYNVACPYNVLHKIETANVSGSNIPYTTSFYE